MACSERRDFIRGAGAAANVGWEATDYGALWRDVGLTKGSWWSPFHVFLVFLSALTTVLVTQSEAERAAFRTGVKF